MALESVNPSDVALVWVILFYTEYSHWADNNNPWIFSGWPIFLAKILDVYDDLRIMTTVSCYLLGRKNLV